MNSSKFSFSASKLVAGAVFSLAACASANAQTSPVPFGYAQSVEATNYGIELACTDSRDPGVIVNQARDYFASKGIPASWLQVGMRPGSHTTNIRLAPQMALTDTLGISRAPRFGVSADLVELLDPRRAPRQVPTVSQKEILLALLHPGRLTRYEGAECGLQALKDDVGVRQTTVAWAQTLNFGWPDGGPAKWNEKYWLKGTLVQGADLHEALTDMVINPSEYSIGCYTAAKIVLAAATLDYYTRVKQSPVQAEKVRAALNSDGDPLVDLEPGVFWDFEPTYVEAEAKAIPGKTLDIKRDVAPVNFVPGDWFYLFNADPVSREKTGYEGSNAIYLGMDRFTDYYNDHEHSFNYKQKVHEVFQWRNGVFSRSRDADKVVPLTDDDYVRLSKTPQENGLLPAMRLVPRPF